MTDKSEIGSLTRLGFRSLPDCLFALPKTYRDYTDAITNINYMKLDEFQAFMLKVSEKKLYSKDKLLVTSYKDAYRVECTFLDCNDVPVVATSFGNVWPWRDLAIGETYMIWGKGAQFNGVPQIASPEIVSPYLSGKVVPVYAGMVGRVSADKVALGVHNARDFVEEAALSLVSRTGLREAQFVNFTGYKPQDLIRDIHWPTTPEIASKAIDAATKAATFALVQSAINHKAKIPEQKSSVPITGSVVAGLVTRLPFSLTGDQANAIQLIIQGLREPFPLSDLISADVGVGKSIVFMIPAVASYMSGAKVAIMAPTQLLANQLHDEIHSYFPEVPLSLITSSAGNKITDGIVIGTTAIITAAKKAGIEFDLVITDEQHKFGSEQRQKLLSAHTNLIESTATPIPRSVALIMYGGYRLIQMTECPVKKSIFTRVVTKENRSKAMEFISGVVNGGKQVAVVYPAVEGNETGDAKSVKDAFSRWDKLYPGRVVMLHGKLNNDEKDQIIEDFKAKKYDVMIASTLIEVGITMPDLGAMVIVEADHFGLAQMHQLRGRVARKGGKGYCFLIPSSECEEDALERIKIMEQCTNGYELAEMDMKNRGFGDLGLETDSQSGRTWTLFWNARLDPKHIEDMAGNHLKILSEV